MCANTKVPLRCNCFHYTFSAIGLMLLLQLIGWPLTLCRSLVSWCTRSSLETNAGVKHKSGESSAGFRNFHCVIDLQRKPYSIFTIRCKMFAVVSFDVITAKICQRFENFRRSFHDLLWLQRFRSLCVGDAEQTFPSFELQEGDGIYFRLVIVVGDSFPANVNPVVIKGYHKNHG